MRGPTGQVRAVEVSIDEGKTWRPAAITYQEGLWSWTLWEAIIDASQAAREKGARVWCRAIDTAGMTQQPETDWNLRGVTYAAVGEKVYNYN